MPIQTMLPLNSIAWYTKKYFCIFFAVLFFCIALPNHIYAESVKEKIIRYDNILNQAHTFFVLGLGNDMIFGDTNHLLTKASKLSQEEKSELYCRITSGCILQNKITKAQKLIEVGKKEFPDEFWPTWLEMDIQIKTGNKEQALQFCADARTDTDIPNRLAILVYCIKTVEKEENPLLLP